MLTGLWIGLMLGALSGSGDFDGECLPEREFDGELRVAWKDGGQVAARAAHD